MHAVFNNYKKFYFCPRRFCPLLLNAAVDARSKQMPFGSLNEKCKKSGSKELLIEIKIFVRTVVTNSIQGSPLLRAT